MPVKHFELSGIDGKRFAKRGEKVPQIKVDHNSTVTMVTELNDKDAALDFRFTTNYSGLGFIKIEGRLIFEGDAPKIAKEWASKNRMPPEVAEEVQRTIFNNCILQEFIIAKEIRLPPPIPLPAINVKGGKVKPSTGVEVA